jgi:uroporphyrinogen III methyltransferase/synthase
MSARVSPLAGKRVLVTRAREQAEKTAAVLRERGAEAVLLPAIELYPPKDPGAASRAVAHAGDYAWVAFTSANGVERAWAALGAMGLGAGVFAGVKLAAIGSGTAEALAERGLRAALVATESKGEGLAEAMLGVLTPGDSVLLLRAQVARDVFPDALRAAGYVIDAVAVYETRLASPEGVEKVAAELAQGAIDAVTFTSASTVDSFVSLMGGDARTRDLLARTPVASIGPITTAALEARGLRADATASPHTLGGLLDALEALFARSPRA